MPSRSPETINQSRYSTPLAVDQRASPGAATLRLPRLTESDYDARQLVGTYTFHG